MIGYGSVTVLLAEVSVSKVEAPGSLQAMWGPRWQSKHQEECCQGCICEAPARATGWLPLISESVQKGPSHL